MTSPARFVDADVSLTWRTTRTTRTSPLTHYGSRRGEHPRYYVRHERRSGALFWIVYYRPGGLQDVELSAVPNTLREAQHAAEADLVLRLNLGEVPPLHQTEARG